jgi:hypothetical protein
MEERIAEHVGPVFVCGIATNLDQFLEMFERVFLLRIDEGTQEARLVANDTESPPGRNEAERDQIRKRHPIDARFPLRQYSVADKSIEHSVANTSIEE